jgi:maltose alpha-D-glucosyltransferase/alpha-amylase
MYYGDEIGMGDNVFLGDRNGVRTPMQWSPDRNGGFSRADPQRLYLPLVMDPVYGYLAVNVEAQMRSPASLLNWTRRLVAARKAHAAFSRGTLRFLRPGNRKVIAYLRTHGDEVLLCVANLARSSQPVELDLPELKGRIPVELLGNTPFPPIGELPYLLTLPAWGFYWFLLSAQADSPRWHAERPVPYEFPALVIPEGLMAALARRDPTASDLRALLGRRVREQLEQDVLPLILPQQHWFDAKGRAIARAALREQAEWATPAGSWLIAMAEVDLGDGSPELYALPLALAWEQGDGASLQDLLHCTFARVRQHARVGILYDAFWDDAFARAVVEGIARNVAVDMPGGIMQFTATHRLAENGWDASLPIKHPAYEQSNTLVLLGERFVLKGFRRLRRGINPEIEMGRFLTEVSPFAHIAALCGSAEYVSAEGDATAVAVLHAYAPNEGSGWDYALAQLKRLVEDALAQSAKATAGPVTGDTSLHGAFRSLMETLGQRTAELHAALAGASGDPAFDPEPFTAADMTALRDKLVEDAAASLALLKTQLAALQPDFRADAERLLARADALRVRIGRLVPEALAADKTRYHGHYHLGQVLIRQHDFVIIDFEGDPALPMEARRAKHSPLRDVACMLRSFGYAAAVAAQHGRATTPADRERVRQMLERWREDTTLAFLAGYRAAIAGVGSYPADPAAAAQLIDAFVLEKALDELRYELSHRADWVGIPLAAVLALVP